ncbi:MAG: ComF family protein, partial [Thermoanaerobaculia bacterium]
MAPTCPGCGRRPADLDRLVAGWHYAPPLDAVLLGLKFGGLGYLGRHLAAALAERHGAELAAVDLLVPIPLHWWRQLGRGYNQAAEIARPLARRLRR